MNIDNININLDEVRQELAKREFVHFADYMNDDLVLTDFHTVYYNILDLFAKGLVKKLIVTVPSQHGKSTGSTINLPSFIFGIEPDVRTAICSYSDTFAQKFNREVQRMIDSDRYRSIFPDTCLNGKRVVTDGNYLRNSHEFEIVDRKGSLKAVGRGGGLTGNRVDIAILDDLYKDRSEGNSPVVRKAVIEWYTSVIRKRLHNGSQQLIVFTRWHEDDLIGYLEEKEKVIVAETWNDIINAGDNWVKVNFEAIKESQPTELDPRQKGEPLFPQMHSLEKLKDDRALDPLEFECMSQGNPATKEGVLYGYFMTYGALPTKPKFVKSQTDPADEGDCFLCNIIYFEHMGLKYVLDVYYTQDRQEITEPEMAKRFTALNVNTSKIESNNGGRAFSRNVKRICREELKNARTSFYTPVQRGNKESRIITNSTTVTNTVVFPEDWAVRWPEFHKHVTRFKADYSSKYKDAPDVLTAMVEGKERAIPIG